MGKTRGLIAKRGILILAGERKQPDELDWNWADTGRKTEESRSLPPGSLEARSVIRISTGSAAHDSDMQQPFYSRPIPTLDVLDAPLYSSRQCRPPPRSRRTEHRQVHVARIQ